MGQAWFKLLSDPGPRVAKALQVQPPVIAIPGDPFLHSVWELPAKAVNIMVLLSGRKISESPGGSLTRIVYQLGHYSTRSTRINSDFGIVSDDLDGTNRGLSGHSFQRHLAIPRPALELLLACGVLWGCVGREILTTT